MQLINIKKIRSPAKDYNEAGERKDLNNCQGPTLVTDIDCFWEECEKIPGSNRRAF